MISLNTNLQSMIVRTNLRSAIDSMNRTLERMTTSTAEGNLDLISNHLQRVRALTEQAANGTYSIESRNAIQLEINERLSEIDRVLETAEYIGLKILRIRQ